MPWGRDDRNAILSSKVDVADAFRRAGNYKNAHILCMEVLGINDEHFGAFECLFFCFMDMGQDSDAQKLVKWRLARLPNCSMTNIYQLFPYGRMKDISDARPMMAKIREVVSQDPPLLEYAEIYFAYLYKSPRKALKRVQAAMDKFPSHLHLYQSFTADLALECGSLRMCERYLTHNLAENPADTESILGLAKVSFLTGRLKKSIRLSKQAIGLDPMKARRFQNIIWQARIGFVPLFWIAMSMIIIHSYSIRPLYDGVKQLLLVGLLLGVAYLTIYLPGQSFTRFWSWQGALICLGVLNLAAVTYVLLLDEGLEGLDTDQPEAPKKLSKDY